MAALTCLTMPGCNCLRRRPHDAPRRSILPRQRSSCRPSPIYPALDRGVSVSGADTWISCASSRAAAYAARYASGAFAKIRTALLYGDFTPDEIAERTGINLLTVRPRTSDLRNPRDADGRRLAPFVVATGQTRSTASGQLADVLRLTSPLERREWACQNMNAKP